MQICVFYHSKLYLMLHQAKYGRKQYNMFTTKKITHYLRSNNIGNATLKYIYSQQQ